jgi:hypothetical protein
VIPLEVTLRHRGYDAVPLLQNVWDPSNKGRLILKILSNDVLGNFHWVTLLDVGETLPTCGPILPLNTQVPANCGLPYLLFAPMLDVHISRGNRVAVSLVVNNPIHKVDMIALFIALSIHVLGDDIHCVLITLAIREINHILPGHHTILFLSDCGMYILLS